MTGRVHILRVGNHYRLVFVPSGPGRHLVEGEDALRNFLRTDLEIPPDVAEMAIASPQDQLPRPFRPIRGSR